MLVRVEVVKRLHAIINKRGRCTTSICVHAIARICAVKSPGTKSRSFTNGSSFSCRTQLAVTHNLHLVVVIMDAPAQQVKLAEQLFSPYSGNLLDSDDRTGDAYCALSGYRIPVDGAVPGVALQGSPAP